MVLCSTLATSVSGCFSAILNFELALWVATGASQSAGNLRAARWAKYSTISGFSVTEHRLS